MKDDERRCLIGDGMMVGALSTEEYIGQIQHGRSDGTVAALYSYPYILCVCLSVYLAPLTRSPGRLLRA